MIKKYKTKNLHRFFKNIALKFPELILPLNEETEEDGYIISFYFETYKDFTINCVYFFYSCEQNDLNDAIFSLEEATNQDIDVSYIVESFLLKTDENPTFYILFEKNEKYSTIWVSHKPI